MWPMCFLCTSPQLLGSLSSLVVGFEGCKGGVIWTHFPCCVWVLQLYSFSTSPRFSQWLWIYHGIYLQCAVDSHITTPSISLSVSICSNLPPPLHSFKSLIPSVVDNCIQIWDTSSRWRARPLALIPGSHLMGSSLSMEEQKQPSLSPADL